MNPLAPTLLCWHSARAGEDVLSNALKALSNRKVNIKQVIYLVQKDSSTQILKLDEGIDLKKLSLPVNDPSNHAEVYKLVSENLLPEICSFEKLHINVSPGTPAMHSVWLVLHAGARFPSGSKLWSSQFNPETKRTRIDEVEFPISTYLGEIRKVTNIHPSLAHYSVTPKSPSRARAFDLLQRYAKVSGAPMLILGERGLGKSRLVETVVGPLKGRRIVALACGGLDSSVVESMLFGHKKGAFTGANEDRQGLIKSADKGILFLDEVQDLPKNVQRKLVRVLQDQRRLYRPVGSDQELSADFELVCASNLDVHDLQAKLDPDFFDRISHLSVEIPPLRSCREDIQQDWQNVWSELRRTEDLPSNAPWIPGIENALSGSELKGNLRSLQKFALQIMAWHDQGILTAVQKALECWDGSELAEKSAFENEKGSRDQRINSFKKNLAEWAKDRYGTWVKAAEALQCNEKTLRDDAGMDTIV